MTLQDDANLNPDNPLALRSVRNGGGKYNYATLDQNLMNLMRWRGDWVAGTHANNECVRHLGLTWIVVATSTSAEPGTSADWQNFRAAAGELWSNDTGLLALTTTPTAIPLTLASSDNPFFTVNGAVLNASFTGVFRIDYYAQWEADVANNQDAGVVINDAIVTGTPTMATGPAASIFSTPRAGLYAMSVNSFGLWTTAKGDEIQFTAQSYAGQSGTTNLLNFAAMITLF